MTGNRCASAFPQRVVGLVFIGAVVLTLAGCPALFEFNLYNGLDPVPVKSAADLAELQSEGDQAVLDYLEEELDSPSFVDKLLDPDDQESTETLAWIETFLEDTWNDTPAEEGSAEQDVQQEAAILYAEVKLLSTGGDDLVNNVVDVVIDGDFTPESGGESDFISDFLTSVVPEDVQNDETAFKALIVAMFEANDAYQALGTSLDPDDDGTNGDLPAGTNAGAVGQNALVAYMVANGSASSDPDTAADAYWELLTNNDTSGVTPSFPDPFTDPSLSNLLEVSGLDTLNATE